ncbi:hypothetical protein [Microcoleus sp. FACHB-672]|uniref:hypothetical protein n=1 Tax=Microcoleus sp. FACHB-672 TaxID=2692825 RepID=UPI0016835903|nr:hypothetical protein [Microcoleus sp. FACHB-672]MBD2039704.1 hypothetical protein [Microcoleus sp. FACHB-672]
MKLLSCLIDAFPYVVSPVVGLSLINAIIPGAAIPAACIFAVITASFFIKYFWAKCDQPKVIYLGFLTLIGLVVGCL